MAVRLANVESISGLIGSGAARPVRFGVMGAITFVVLQAGLEAFKQAGFGSIIGYALALAVSVQFNFLVNQLFVWHDRPLTLFSRQGLDRYVAFHGFIAISLLVNLLAFIVAQMFMSDFLAAVVGVGASTGLKFLSLDKLAFKPAAE